MKRGIFKHFASIVLLLIGVNTSQAQTWTDKSFEDLSRGTLDASGQNIYIKKTGGISTIRRFDVDRDGYIDLLFNNTHDDDVFVPATLASADKNRVIVHDLLSVNGSIAVEVADLNKDGYMDIVFCPNQSGIQSPRRLLNIMWGGKDGWNSSRFNGVLPVNGVTSIAIADINGDGWPDIATLNSSAWLPKQPEGNIIRVYLGSEDGYILNRFQDIGVEDAVKISASDLDNDGFKDIAVLTSDHTIKVIWSSKGNERSRGSDEHTIDTINLKIAKGDVISLAEGDVNNDGNRDLVVGTDREQLIVVKGENGRRFSEPFEIEGVYASSITIADLDKDGSPDIIASKFSMRRAAGGEMMGGAAMENDNVVILWGQNGLFSAERSLELDAPYTAATAAVDIDGDGILDIVCATHQGEKTYAAESAIFYGKKHRKFERASKGIPSEGAIHIAAIPESSHDRTFVVIANSRTGTLNEAVPLSLYFGSKEGFSTKRLLEIPFSSGYESSAADLNDDGYVDLIAIDSGHARLKDSPFAGVNILWGGKDGFDLTNRRTVLSENLASTSNVADLNKDGYLDIIVGFFNPPDGTQTDLVIYYGSENGYSRNDRVAIPSPGRSGSPNVADYNNDGWLDIAVTSYIADRVRIFYGSEKGFSETDQKTITVPAPIDLETADLNNDGFADLIVPIYKDRVNNFHDAGVLIFWGGAEGFKQWNSQWLASTTVLGPTVADFDNDGYLDLFLPAYLGDNNRQSLPMYLYWGSKTGFSEDNRTEFIGDSGSDALAADFDNDGKIDLAIAEHAKNSGHRKPVSRVYYNDGDRFRSSGLRVESLRAMGTHWIWNYDIGHIMTRKYEHSYTSKVATLNENAANGRISVDMDNPPGGKMIVQVRSSGDKESLEKEGWSTVEDTTFALKANSRLFQYKLVFRAANGDGYPAVKSVSVSIGQAL
ncbi:MAG: VCBS repeat-containing protein [Acidobacteria bacterium]|nr:VCBS repeat-containing protein [Acidobacteriota bacterium]